MRAFWPLIRLIRDDLIPIGRIYTSLSFLLSAAERIDDADGRRTRHKSFVIGIGVFEFLNSGLL